MSLPLGYHPRHEAEACVRRFVYQIRDSLDTADLERLFEVNGGNDLRCALFATSCDKLVTYDDVFTGRILYEACAVLPPETFARFLSQDFSQLYGISEEARDRVTAAFREQSNATKIGRRQVFCCRVAARLSIGVLAQCDPVCLSFSTANRIGNSFIDALCGIKGDCSVDCRLPPFGEFLTRWKAAVGCISDGVERGTLSGTVHRLTEAQGNAWISDVSPSPDDVPPRLMEASDCFEALRTLDREIENLLSRDYVDVRLGFTKPQSTKPSSIQVVAHDVQLGDVRSRALGISGDFLSPTYIERFKAHVFGELAFAHSPSGNRRIRISSKTAPQVFLLGGHPIESVPFTAMESEFSMICEYIMSPAKELMKEYCRKNHLRYNPALEYSNDMLQMVVGAIKDSAYKVHNDLNCLLCDDGYHQDELQRPKVNGDDIQVFTLCIADPAEEHDLSLDFYYPGEEACARNLVASVDIHGQLFCHGQLPLLQRSRHLPRPAPHLTTGHGVRLVMSTRSTSMFQEDSQMLLERLQKFGLPTDRAKWITTDQYNVNYKGDSLLTAHHSNHSVARNQAWENLKDASSKVAVIDVPSDRFQVHELSSSRGPVAQALKTDYVIGVDQNTWEIFASAPMMKHFLKERLFVRVRHTKIVIRGRKRKRGEEPHSEEVTHEDVEYGPLFIPSPADPTMRQLEWPTQHFYDAQQTAARLSLRFTDRKHQVIRTDRRFVADVMLQLPERNDVLGISACIKWWAARLRHFMEKTEDPKRHESPPEFWFGSPGGGSVTAGERDCPDLGSARADKFGPDGYTAGGRREGHEQQSLSSIYYRNLLVRVHLRLDPTSPFAQKLGILPEDCSPDRPLDIYLGLVEVYDVDHDPDSEMKLSQELEELGLDDYYMKYVTFRTRPHDKFRARYVQSLDDFYNDSESEQPWRPLNLHGSDSFTVHTRRPRRAQVMTDSTSQTADDDVDMAASSGSTEGTAAGSSREEREVTVTKYLSPGDPRLFVGTHTVIREYLATKDYEKFIPGDVRLDNDDEMGDLPSGICVTVEEAVVAQMHSSVANFARFLGLNVHEYGSAGFLSGPEFSQLSVVNRLRTSHSPCKEYDLNTAHYKVAIFNTIANEFKILSLYKARTEHLSPACDETGHKILALALQCSFITRTAGRFNMLDEFSKYHQQKSTKDTADHRFPYYPAVDQDDIALFIEFVKGTCADSDGNVTSMSQWTGMGDASSIPEDCRRPLTYCSFVKCLSAEIDDLAIDICQCIDAASARSGGKGWGTLPEEGQQGTREHAVAKVKSFFEKFLQKDKLKGCEFKASQVRKHGVSACGSPSFTTHCMLFVFVVSSFCLCSKIVWDLELLFPGIFGHWSHVHTGYGSKQGFKTWTFGHSVQDKCEKYNAYLVEHATDDMLTVMGQFRHEVPGHPSIWNSHSVLPGGISPFTKHKFHLPGGGNAVDRAEAGLGCEVDPKPRDECDCECDDGESEGDQELEVHKIHMGLQLGTPEHPSCGSYQMHAPTLPNRRLNLPMPAVPHCFPAKRYLLDQSEQMSEDDCSLRIGPFDSGFHLIAVNSVLTFFEMVRNGTWPSIAESYRLSNGQDARDALDQIPCANQMTLKWLQSIATGCCLLDNHPADMSACMPQEKSPPNVLTPQPGIKGHFDMSSSHDGPESDSVSDGTCGSDSDSVNTKCRKVPRLGGGSTTNTSSSDGSDRSESEHGRGSPTSDSRAAAYWDSKCRAVCDL